MFVSGIVFSVTVRVSILLILLISITRMIAILFPIKYRTITSPNRLYVILGLFDSFIFCVQHVSIKPCLIIEKFKKLVEPLP